MLPPCGNGDEGRIHLRRAEVNAKGREQDGVIAYRLSVKRHAGGILRDGDGFDQSPDGAHEGQNAEGNEGDAELGDALACVPGVEIVNP